MNIQKDSKKLVSYLPALINFLAFLGWNPGTEREIFSLQELVDEFSEKRINKAGTKFDFDKAKWFNQQYIKNTDSSYFVDELIQNFKEQHQINCSHKEALQIIDLLKERVTFPHEFVEEGLILFQQPSEFDEKVVRKKWNEEAAKALTIFADEILSHESVTAESAKTTFWETLESKGFKPGQFMQPLRLILTGQGSGPDLMTIIEILGSEKTSDRIKSSIDTLNQ